MSRDPYDRHAEIGQGLAFCEPAMSDAAPRYIESDIIAPVRTFGLGTKSTLKATFWQCNVEETIQQGDPDFVSIALNTGGGRVWRNGEATANIAGGISMMPFEGARWNFEGLSSFAQIYVPFTLVRTASDSLYGRDLAPDAMRMPSAVRHDALCVLSNAIYQGLTRVEPTNLLLDSWALLVSDILVRCYSRHAGAPTRTSFGKLPPRGIAQVIDYVEAHIDHDLDLASLAAVAAMSVYHFARRFRETVGVSPHAYVLARRVRHAREMLKGNGSLAYVASACGFASQSHLTTVFRSHLGVTPGEYRRLLS